VSARMMAVLAADHAEKKTVMIDATYFKANRTATSTCVKKVAWTSDWANQRRNEHESACLLRSSGASSQPVCYCRTIQRLHRCAGAF
jgi:hypothetical protein